MFSYKEKRAIILFLILLSATYISPAAVLATDLPIRGIARGESKIKVGDRAPLITPALEQANKEGKLIVLMLGYQSHCPWCDRMERYVNAAMKETNNFNNHVAFIVTQTEHVKMLPPPEDGTKLKEAYGVEGQPWLFIIDKDGIVRFVYRVFIGSNAFKENIRGLLGVGK